MKHAGYIVRAGSAAAPSGIRLSIPPKIAGFFSATDSILDTVRKTAVDAGAGLVSWMSPSFNHEILGRRTGILMNALEHVMNIPVSEDLGSTKWGRHGTRLEADACFYTGDRAVAYDLAYESGNQEIHRFIAEVPPDLAIEIDVTHHDRKKENRWAEIGATELWNIESPRGTVEASIRMTGLSLPEGNRTLRTSLLFPGLDPQTVTAGIGLVRKSSYAELEEFLDARIRRRPAPHGSDGPEPS